MLGSDEMTACFGGEKHKGLDGPASQGEGFPRLRTNEGSPDCENVLPRTTLSSAGQNHNRGRRHVARDNPLEDRKRDSKPYGLGIRAW